MDKEEVEDNFDMRNKRKLKSSRSSKKNSDDVVRDEIDLLNQTIDQSPRKSTKSSTTDGDENDIEIDIDINAADDSKNKMSVHSKSNRSNLVNNKQEKFINNKKLVVKSENGSPSTSSTAKRSRKRRGSGTSSEEERWLTAIESGKLEEVEDVELKKIKDPKLMTARQRAIYDRNHDTESAPGFTEILLALPIGYKEKEKPQTAEELQKAALKLQKRKQQADEKREKDKKKTMERLLKKQESKQRITAKPKFVKETQPIIRYRNTTEGAYIQMPPGYDFPLEPKTAKQPPPIQLCGIVGCGRPKIYNCSKTNIPLCSYACYRKNVQSLKEIMC